MASLEQIGAALKAADAAGNVEDAKRLAAAYKQMQAQNLPVQRISLQGRVSPRTSPPPEGSENIQQFQVGSTNPNLAQVGNIDLNSRQVFNAPDGGYRTENSFSIGTDQGEVLIPSVVNGRQLTEDEAIQHYQQTGENLGIFRTPEAADSYAQSLHERQAQRYAPKPPNTYDNYGSQIISGVGEGIGNILGAPVDLATTAINLGTTGINALTGTDIPQIKDPALGSNAFRGMLSTVGAIRPESNDPAKRFARRASQDVGSALVPSLSIAGRAAQPIQALVAEALMATGSGVGGAAAEEMFPGNPLAETIGGLGGAVTGAGIGRAARKAVTPFPSDPARIAAADTMRNEGVDLSAGQQTGSQGLKYAEAELGGGAATRLTERQAQQFTQAALRRIGENAERATPEVMQRAYDRIGGVFNDVGARNQIVGDRQLVDDLRDTWDAYTGGTAPSDRIPKVQSFISDIAAALRSNGGVLRGDVYTDLRSRLGALARQTTNKDVKEAYYGIQHSLDDAMERNMSPDDIADFRNARREYRNFITLEAAGVGAGENAALGLISPAQLRQATVNTQGKRNYVTGSGDFADLSRSGVATMSPLPQSGTAPRLAVNAVKGGVPTVAALLAGGGAINPLALAGLVGGYGAVKGTGYLMTSPVGRRYLANQLMRPGSRAEGAGIGALTGIGSQQTSEPLQITVGRGR